MHTAIETETHLNLLAPSLVNALTRSVRAENGMGQHYIDPEHPVVQQAIELAQQIAPGRVLEFGAGRGLVSLALACEVGVPSLVATDINEPGILELKEKAQRLHLPIESLCFDAASQTLPPHWLEAFDMVVVKDVYPFLTPEQNSQMIKNLWRVLRPGGMFILTAPSTDSQLYRESIATNNPHFRLLTSSQQEFIQTNIAHFSFADADQLQELFALNNLELLSTSLHGRANGWISAEGRKVGC